MFGTAWGPQIHHYYWLIHRGGYVTLTCEAQIMNTPYPYSQQYSEDARICVPLLVVGY